MRGQRRRGDKPSMKSRLKFHYFAHLGALIITRQGTCLLFSRTYKRPISSALWRGRQKICTNCKFRKDSKEVLGRWTYTLNHDSLLAFYAKTLPNDESTGSEPWSLDEDAEWLRQIMELDLSLSLAAQPEVFDMEDPMFRETTSTSTTDEHASLSGETPQKDSKRSLNNHNRSSTPTQEKPATFESEYKRADRSINFPTKDSLPNNKESFPFSEVENRKALSSKVFDPISSGSMNENTFPEKINNALKNSEKSVDLGSGASFEDPRDREAYASTTDEIIRNGDDSGQKVTSKSEKKEVDKLQENEDVLTRSFMRSVEAKLRKLGYGEEMEDLSSKEIDLILRNNIPAKAANDNYNGSNRSQRRRERQPAPDRIPNRRQTDKPAPRSPESRRQGRESRSSRLRDEARRRPVKNQVSSEDDYLVGNKWWPGLESFGEALREETKMRSKILGPGFNKILKEEGKWRYDLYKAWLKLLKDGVASDMDVVPTSSRYEDTRTKERSQASARRRRKM